MAIKRPTGLLRNGEVSMGATANGSLISPIDSQNNDQIETTDSEQMDSAPSEADLNTLREQIAAAERQREYDDLKARLENIQGQGNDLEGAIQTPDAEKVLHTKRKSTPLIERIILRITQMLSPRPVVGNIIAIGLAMVALHFLRHEITLEGFGKYQNYIGIGLLIFGATQVVKSGTRSLFIPMVTMIAGAVISHTLPGGEHFLGYTAKFYQYVMITGIIGLGISVLTID